MRTKVDDRKAVEVLLFVTQQVHDTYHVLKVLYFADKCHLEKYGRLIYGDSYVAMDQGPVPSLAYDIVKDAGGRKPRVQSVDAAGTFSIADKYNIIPARKPNLDELSESDIECLGEAMRKYGTMPKPILTKKSHEEKAFFEAAKNAYVPIEDIVGMLPDSASILDYMRNY